MGLLGEHEDRSSLASGCLASGTALPTSAAGARSPGATGAARGASARSPGATGATGTRATSTRVARAGTARTAGTAGHRQDAVDRLAALRIHLPGVGQEGTRRSAIGRAHHLDHLLQL